MLNYIRRGLFEQDKLTGATLLTFNILINDDKMKIYEGGHALLVGASAEEEAQNMFLQCSWKTTFEGKAGEVHLSIIDSCSFSIATYCRDKYTIMA